MQKTDLVYLRINGMPCVNRCSHCYLDGSPGSDCMSSELICAILDSAADYKGKTGCTVFPQFFQEPTLHPDFLEIIERQFRLGLTFDNFWFPTNGHGLANMSDEGWARLAKTGLSWIRLSFHGLEEQHDIFTGRKGAFGDLVKTAVKAEEFGLEWFAGVFINRKNAGDYQIIKSCVETIGHPATEVGWMVPQWLGRAECDAMRPTIDQIHHIQDQNPIWKSEESIVENILSDSDLCERKAFDRFFGSVFLGIDPGGRVTFAGGCDGDPFLKHSESMVLGSFPENNDIGFFVNEYLRNPPEPVRILEGITWRELAERYGDPTGRMVFSTRDLVVNKWGSMYLADQLNS